MNIAARAPRRWTLRSLWARKEIIHASERQRPASKTVVVARLVVPVAVGRGGSKSSVVAAGSGRTTTAGWTLEEGQLRHRQRRPGQWWVMVVQRRLAVAAAEIGAVRRKRWIRTGAAGAV